MRRRDRWSDGEDGRRGDPFGYAIAGLGGGMASIVGWLSFAAPDTVEGLRADIDRAGLTFRTAVELIEPVVPPDVPDAPPLLLIATARPAQPGLDLPVLAEVPAQVPVVSRPGPIPAAPVPDVQPITAGLEPEPPVRPVLLAAGEDPLSRLDALVPAAGPVAPRRPGVSLVIQLFDGDAAEIARLDDRFPAEVAVALSPYLATLEDTVEAVRRAGRRALIEAPLATDGTTDAGPLGLATADPAVAELALARIAARAPGADALVATGEATVDLVAAALNAGVPLVTAGTVIGDPPVAAAIDEALAQVEFDARLHGHAVAVVHTTPLTIDRVARWAKGLDERGIVLVDAPVPARSQFGALPQR